MLMASMLAMVLLAASPVMAQEQTADQDNAQAGAVEGSGSVVNNAANIVQQCQSGDQYVVDGDGNVLVSSVQCNQIINLVQAGEDAEQAVAQVIGVEQDTTGVQYGDDEAPAGEAPAGEAPAPGVDDDGDGVVDEEGETVAPAGDDAAAAAEAGDAEAGAVAVLPDTGGASLFTLGAGALLVAGGLLARRIVR